MTTTDDGFAHFGLSEPVLAGVREAGFTTPSPIQAAAIPVLLAGKDLVAQAQTGTGKTAAFGLPALSKLEDKRAVQVLVITPTRELCAQVADELYRLGKHAGARTVAVYGGANGYRQVEQIARGAQIVVATPGRLLDHLDGGRLPRFAPKLLVLDEADEMLDMGFLEDIERIVAHLPKDEARQTALFSATMPDAIKSLANRILKDPTRIDLTATETFKTDVEQYYYVMDEPERVDALTRLIDAEEPDKALIFCRTKREADDIATLLIGRGQAAKALHGDLDQRQRQDAVAAFKAGKIQLLVATDVAARGLDIRGISHVFNFRMPFDQEAYVHRIGRTGRAGAKGKAATLVTPWEFQGLRRIQRAIKASFIPGEIPTLSDLARRRDEVLVKTIMAQEPRDGAVDVLAALNQSMDASEAALRMISMLMDKDSPAGPERIGAGAKQRVDRLLERERAPRGGDDRPRFARGKGAPQGGGYRGQGGGYRGQGGGYRGQGGGGYRGERRDDAGAGAGAEGGDRPRAPYRRDDGDARPPYRRDDARPPYRREGGDARPPYRRDDARPPQRRDDGDARPQQGDRPPGRFGGAKRYDKPPGKRPPPREG